MDYRADVDVVARYLPAPLEPDPTGRAFAIVDELVCVPGDDPELVYSNPERTRYTEGVVGLAVLLQGRARDIHERHVGLQGLVDDVRQFHGLAEEARPYPLDPCTAQPPHAETDRRGLERAWRGGAGRLPDRGRVGKRLDRKEEDSAAPAFGWLYSVRYYPEMGPTVPAVKQLIRNRIGNTRAINVYSGEGNVELGESDNEELTPLRPVEVIRGYYYSPCWTTGHGAELLETYE